MALPVPPACAGSEGVNARGVAFWISIYGMGKTTLLTCISRICNPLAFAHGFSSSHSFSKVDQYRNSEIAYTVCEGSVDSFHVVYKKGKKRWASTPRMNSSVLSEAFQIPFISFIKADSSRISAKTDEIEEGVFESVDSSISEDMNRLFETDRFQNLKRLRIARPGQYPPDFYVLQEENTLYYSEKRFSTGEVSLLRLVERIRRVEDRETGGLILIDEAELSLHPRIQMNLLNYLKEISEKLNLTVIIATHSVTMIKAVSNKQILLMNSEGQGRYSIINPCYYAQALGSVDFESNVGPDVYIFCEDDMARLILECVIPLVCDYHHRIRYDIVPVGGWAETAKLASDVSGRIGSRARVCAFWDHDVFEIIPTNKTAERLHEQYRQLLNDLCITPETWLIESMQNDKVKEAFKREFHIEVSEIQSSRKYAKVNSEKARERAKKQFNVVVDMVKQKTGDRNSRDIVIKIIVDASVRNTFPLQEIKESIMRVMHPE